MSYWIEILQKAMRSEFIFILKIKECPRKLSQIRCFAVHFQKEIDRYGIISERVNEKVRNVKLVNCKRWKKRWRANMRGVYVKCQRVLCVEVNKIFLSFLYRNKDLALNKTPKIFILRRCLNDCRYPTSMIQEVFLFRITQKRKLYWPSSRGLD